MLVIVFRKIFILTINIDLTLKEFKSLLKFYFILNT